MSNWTKTFRAKLSQLWKQNDEFDEDYDPEIAAPEVVGTTGLLGDLLIKLILFPLQILFLPMRLLELFHQSGVEVGDDYEEASFLEKGLRIGKTVALGVLSIPYLMLTSPIRFFQGLGRSGLREILFVVPALLMIGLLGYVFAQVFARGEVIKNRYAKGISAAITNQDYKLAKTYFGRLMQDGELTQPQKLQWMLVLEATGEPEKAQEVLDELAPENNLGYGKAHTIKALQLATQISSGRAESDSLVRLGRHLGRCTDNSTEILQARAIYYQGIGDEDKAVQAMSEAAENKPTLYFGLANYQRALGRMVDYRSTLKLASAAFRDRLADQPLDEQAAIQLAEVLNLQNRVDNAEKILLEAFRRQQTPRLQQALAGFYVMRFRRAKENNEPTAVQLKHLMTALSYDPNHPPVYQELTQMYLLENTDTKEQLATIRQELVELVAGNQPNPMAHFSLSNILWKEDKQKEAEFHLMQAYQLNPEFIVILNNLAWVLAHKDEAPDLDRAMELADKAVEFRPDNPQYRDTRGTILLKMGKHREAITDLSLALAGVRQPKLVHKKLYECYRAMGMNDIAQTHLKNSK